MSRNTTIILTGSLLALVILFCTFWLIENQKKMMAVMNSMGNEHGEPNFTDEKESESEESIMTVKEERNPIGFKMPEKKA